MRHSLLDFVLRIYRFPARSSFTGLRLHRIPLGIVGEELLNPCGRGELSTGQNAGGAGAQMHRLDVGRIEPFGGLGRLGGQSGGEDGEVGDLHGVAVEDELADAVHHVGQHT